MTPTDTARLQAIGITLTEFGRRTGYSFATVSRWGKTGKWGIPVAPLWVGELIAAWEAIAANDLLSRVATAQRLVGFAVAVIREEAKHHDHSL